MIKWVKFASGERLPLLINRSDGLPIEIAVDWIISERRVHKQARTIEADLQNLQFLFLWADIHNINFEDRIASGRFFKDEELKSLLHCCGSQLWAILDELAERRFLSNLIEGCVPELPSDVIPLPRRVRLRNEAVNRVVKRNRLQTIHAFLSFLSSGYEGHLSVDGSAELLTAYAARRRSCLDRIKLEYRSIQPNDDSSGRKGLSPEVQQKLLAVIEPEHPDNPWETEVRIRNRIIFLLLYNLGIRRGELLGLRTDDLQFTADNCVVSIHRRPDDPLDQRIAQPTTKTLPRTLLAGNRLSSLLHEYVTDIRRKLGGAKRHPYLIVDARCGHPLSLSAVNKLFAALRNRIPQLPSDLTPHVLRHTWNDRFSDNADKKNMSHEREEKVRKHQMGWCSRSKMASRYTKRHTERAANKISVEMQENLGVFANQGDKEPEK
jgi:integrase